ncbi:MAG TPA: C40 family peptidase [Ktedonobacterales bacterium]|nr:C40 family peptidase [Ktedonobacterales bacterium]
MTSATRHSQAPTSHARRTRRALAVAVGVADVRRDPDANSEQVTQALLGASAVPLETSSNGWTRIRLVDYEGWIRDEQLASPTRTSARVAVVMATHTPLYTSWRGDASDDEVFATSILPVTEAGQRAQSGRVRVALPGGRTGWVDADAVNQRPADHPFPQRSPETAIALARQLLGVPYLWGGVSQRGIDCSGLAQLACRAAGVIIPRDADQQYEDMPFVVDRASVRLGDLVFFASNGAVTHVGIALDNMTLLHASGSGESVIITSLDPAEGSYPARLAGMYAGARRAFTEQDTIQ